MKQIIKYILAWGIVLTFCCSCENINDIHEEYLNRGETIYTGVVDSLAITPGNERAKFKWLLNADPRITKVVIYWAQRTDSVVVEVNRTQAGAMWMEEILPFAEDSYIFEVVTKDDYGHRSMAESMTVDVYGPEYIGRLMNREIRSRNINSSGEGVLTWAAILSNAIQYTLVKYTDYSDPANPVDKEVRVENDDTETILPGVRVGDVISVSSIYLPEGALDELASNARSYTF